MNELDAALDLLKRYHEMGHYHRNLGSKIKIKSEYLAEYETLKKPLQQKIRQFADPEDGYSKPELDTLLRMCKKAAFPIGYSLVIRLMAVPKQDRLSIQKRVIRQEIRRRDLDNYISSMYGARRKGGRKPRKYESTADALAGLRSMCLAWKNTATSLTSEAAVQHKIIPTALRNDYQMITEQMNRFYKRVNRAQERLREE